MLSKTVQNAIKEAVDTKHSLYWAKSQAIREASHCPLCVVERGAACKNLYNTMIETELMHCHGPRYQTKEAKEAVIEVINFAIWYQKFKRRAAEAKADGKFEDVPYIYSDVRFG